jgi:outer membrane immunogenic protein
MKKFLVVGIIAAAFWGAPAFATDMPTPPPRAPVYKDPPPVFGWTGCYVGGNVGYGRQRTVTTDPLNNPIPGAYSEDGMVGGGQVGCDYQSDG